MLLDKGKKREIIYLEKEEEYVSLKIEEMDILDGLEKKTIYSLLPANYRCTEK